MFNSDLPYCRELDHSKNRCAGSKKFVEVCSTGFSNSLDPFVERCFSCELSFSRFKMAAVREQLRSS